MDSSSIIFLLIMLQFPSFQKIFTLILDEANFNGLAVFGLLDDFHFLGQHALEVLEPEAVRRFTALAAEPLVAE